MIDETAAANPISLQGLHFVMYLAKDMQRARTFYESLFEIEPADFDSEYFVEYDLADGNTFALACDPSAEHRPTGGAMFGVADAEQAIACVQALGGLLIKRYGGEICTSGWCTDTEGNAFGVHQRK